MLARSRLWGGVVSAQLNTTLPNLMARPHILGSRRVSTGASLVHPTTLTLFHRAGSRRIPAPAAAYPRQHALARHWPQIPQAWRPHCLRSRRPHRLVTRQHPPFHIRPRSVRYRIALLAALAILLIAAPSIVHYAPVVVWNATSSVATGLYRVVHRPPRRGDLVLLALPDHIRHISAARGYLALRSLLIKPVAAVSGETVCRLGSRVWTSGHVSVTARSADALGRSLPFWRGCRVLRSTEIFVLAPPADSFDSRYFGPVDGRFVVGVAVPIWTTPFY